MILQLIMYFCLTQPSLKIQFLSVLCKNQLIITNYILYESNVFLYIQKKTN